MPKSKQQKRDEAKWRRVVGELVENYRRNTDAHLRAQIASCNSPAERQAKEWYEGQLSQREELWESLCSAPWSWRQNALKGWSIPKNLADRWAVHLAEERASRLESVLPEGANVPRKPRM